MKLVKGNCFKWKDYKTVYKVFDISYDTGTYICCNTDGDLTKHLIVDIDEEIEHGHIEEVKYFMEKEKPKVIYLMSVKSRLQFMLDEFNMTENHLKSLCFEYDDVEFEGIRNQIKEAIEECEDRIKY